MTNSGFDGRSAGSKKHLMATHLIRMGIASDNTMYFLTYCGKSCKGPEQKDNSIVTCKRCKDGYWTDSNGNRI